MDLFLVSIITAYISPNFLLLVISWTIAELLGYILVKLGEEHSTEGSLTSSRGFIFTSTMTYELSVFTMITLSIIFTTLNIGISQLIKPFSTINTLIEVSPYLIPLLILGFFVKTAKYTNALLATQRTLQRASTSICNTKWINGFTRILWII